MSNHNQKGIVDLTDGLSTLHTSLKINTYSLIALLFSLIPGVVFLSIPIFVLMIVIGSILNLVGKYKCLSCPDEIKNKRMITISFVLDISAIAIGLFIPFIPTFLLGGFSYIALIFFLIGVANYLNCRRNVLIRAYTLIIIAIIQSLLLLLMITPLYAIAFVPGAGLILTGLRIPGAGPFLIVLFVLIFVAIVGSVFLMSSVYKSLENALLVL